MTAYVNAVMFALVCSSLAVSAAPATTGVAKSDGFLVQPPFVEPSVPQSTFQVPKKSAEGRDPFFPKSVRIYGVDSVTKTVPTPTPIAELALKGISGTPEQPLAIINNATFSTGEEGDVATRAGRIRIRCVEINMSAGTVLVQVGGQSRELRLAPSK
jgi:hypothetical protein